MNFEIVNNEIFSTKTIETKTQSVIITQGYGFLNKTKINASDLSNVIFQWYKFDLEEQDYIVDNDNTDSFMVDVNGNIVEVPHDETLQITFEEAGTYTVKTINQGVGNDSVEVVYNGET